MLVRDKSGAEKLRGERQFCRRVSVFIRTSPHAVNEVFLRKQRWRKAHPAHPRYAGRYWHDHTLLDRIWLEGRQYMKAGIMLDDFTPDGVSQLNLFDDMQPRKNSVPLIKVLDDINQSGQGNM